MRVRLLALMAALAVLAGACGTVPGDAVATVNGSEVAYDRFERIVAAQAAGLGLDARDAQVAQQAIDAGVIDRAALDDALLEDLGRAEPNVSVGPPVEVPDAFMDQLYDQAVSAEDVQQELGVGQRRLREVFERLVRHEVRGLALNQGQTGFPIGRSAQLTSLQQSVIQQLVQAEIYRQAVEELDVEVDEQVVDQVDQQFRAQLGDDEALTAALEDAGYTREDYTEIFVMTQARQQALQGLEDPAAAQEYFADLDVEVAERFGSWDPAQGQVVAPSDPV